MQKWEYRGLGEDYDKKKRTGAVFGMEEGFSGNLIDALNILGQEGWELTAYTTMDVGDAFIHHYIFKKPAAG